MLAKAYANIQKFKMIEAAARQGTNDFRTAIEKVDEALSAKRTPAEVAFLTQMRQKLTEVHEQSKAIVGYFIENVPL